MILSLLEVFMPEDNLSKFKEIIARLPEDKRKLLYKRLHDMPPSKREAYIADFTRKYYINHKKTGSGKASSSQSIITGILSALLILGLFYFIYIFNKPAIDGKFNQMLGMPAEDTIDTSPEGSDIMGPEPAHFPTDTPTPVPATPTPSPVPLADDHPDLSGLVIVIDPGHQQDYNHELEEIGGGVSAEKEKASPGATGITSGVKEYELTLEYALLMKEYLEGCGASVILTRQTNDVDLSNAERAQIAIDSDADYFIRLHADCAPDAEIKGVKVYVPATGDYASSAESDGEALAEAIADGIGSTSLGAVQSNMYTGLNYADSIESYQIVIGYLSNSDDDALLSRTDTPYKTAVAVADFIGN